MVTSRLTPRPSVPVLIHVAGLGALLVPDLSCGSADAPTDCHPSPCVETTETIMPPAGSTGSTTTPTGEVATTSPCAQDTNPDDCDSSATTATNATSGTDTDSTTTVTTGATTTVTTEATTGATTGASTSTGTTG